MKRILIFILTLLSLTGCADKAVTVDNTTVKQLDLKKFMGNGMRLPATITNLSGECPM